MKTFNVGPSMLSQNTKNDIKDAVDSKILELSHRSAEFSSISEQAVRGLYNYFKLPEDYKIFYTSSSTAAMQLALANCCDSTSHHFINGSFSGLSSKIAEVLHKKVSQDLVDYGELNQFSNPDHRHYDLVAMAHNETSSGVMCSLADLAGLRKSFPDSILAVDITSSAGAIDFEMKDADIWYFSVQKCFGLPAGLGLIFVSPRAYAKSLKLSQQKRNLAGHFSFENMWGKMDEKYQTLETPNVLNIYLLSQKIKRWIDKGGVATQEKLTRQKYKFIEEAVAKSKNLDFFVANPLERSISSVCLKGNEDYIAEIHKHCQANNLILGNGYGQLKKTTVRIANFLTVTESDLREVFETIS